MLNAEPVRLTAVDVCKSYDGRSVLHGVSVDVEIGEWVALIGPSGSGKTTMLSIAGGLLEPDGGSVAVVRRQGDASPAAPHVAWVLQTTNALGNRSVLDNAAIGGLADGFRAGEAASRANEVLARLGLGSLAQERARTLSGGERQRLSIARALTSARRFLLADEPTGQLDRVTSDRVVEQMRGATTDVGVLLATHDPHLLRWCDTVVPMGGARTNE